MKLSSLQTILTFTLVSLFFSAGTAWGLLADHDCSFCHQVHSAPGFSLLNQANAANGILTAELVCLNCHGPDGSATQVEVHNSTKSDYKRISCRECHDPHSNRDNSDGGTNQALVGYNRDPADLTTTLSTASIRQIDKNNRSHSDPNTRTPVTYENRGPTVWDYADTANPSDKICRICHLTENFTSHKGEGNVVGDNCQQCHPHSGGFPEP